MTAPDLLPCPFCGGEASAWNLTLEGAVRCADCRATIVRQHKPVYDTGYEEAIAAWNTRATPAPAAMTPEVAKLVEALKLALDYVEGCKANNLPDLGAASGLPFMDDVLRVGDAALRAGGDA